MAHKIARKDNRYLARLVTGKRAPCAFCLRDVDDEIIYGKLYAIGDIQCHYFCCLLSCCLIQKGHDEEGLYGFMYPDILAEVERCKKHKCSYCGRVGANLGCSVGACRKQFHLPCGRDKNAVSLYYGTYKTFCQLHAPKQKIPDHIMERARLRKKVDRIKGKQATELHVKLDDSTEQMVCVICYEAVEGFPTVNTFWPPCCGKDAWFHRSCLQRMALSAGMHYLKCPLCNDKENFYDAVVNQGYYVPDRDAAWELEQNAFAEIYERATTCGAETCLCARGRGHDEETGKWDIKLCLLCGSAGAHVECIIQSQPSKRDSLSLVRSEKITEANTWTDQPETKEFRDLSNETNGSRNEDSLSLEQSNTYPNHLNTCDQLKKCFEQCNTSSDQINTSPTQSNTTDQLNPSFARLNTYPTESNTSSSGPNTSPSGPNTSPSGPNTSPSGPYTSPSGPNTSPSGPYTSPSGPNTSPSELNTSSSESNTSHFDSNTSPTQTNTSPDKSSTCVRYVCRSCLPAAPEDLDALASSLEAMIQREQTQNTGEARPLMTSRMSLRRTKAPRAVIDRPSTSRIVSRVETDYNISSESESSNVASSRLELNLKSPRRLSSDIEPVRRWSETKLLSPIKLLEQGFREKMVTAGVREVALDTSLVETLRKRFRKPRPMCERRRVVDDILNGIFDDLLKESKQKEQVKEWCSPKKAYESIEDSINIQHDFNNLSKGLNKNKGKENDSNVYNTPTKDDRNHKIEETTLNLMNKDEIIKNYITKHQNDDENMKNNVTEHHNEEHSKIQHQNDEENMKNIDVSKTLMITDEDLKNNESKYENSDVNFKRSEVERHEIETEETLPVNTKEQCELLKKNENAQCDKELSRKNPEGSRPNTEEEENYKAGRNSDPETDIRDVIKHCNENNEDTNKIEDWFSNAGESFRKTRNSTKLIIRIKENNNEKIENNNSNEIREIKDTSTKTKESCKKLKKSFSEPVLENSENENMKIDETNTAKDKYKHPEQKRNDISDKTGKITKKSLTLKRNHSKNDKRSLKGVEKSKHSFKNNPFSDKQKLRSKSESSTDINILKRLAEKDLRSQLLLELTRGKVNEKRLPNNATDFDNQKNINESRINTTEAVKLVNDAPKSLQETPKHEKISKSSDGSRKSNQTTKYSNETTKSQKGSKPLKNLETDQKDSNMIKDPNKTPSCIPKTGKVLETDSKILKTENKKTTKPSVKSPKSFEKALRDLDQLISTQKHSKKSKHKSIKNSKVSSKVFDKNPKSQTPNTMNLVNNSNPNSPIDIPKHKTIEIQHDSSLEISENNQHINIDVIKIEDSPTTDESYKNLKIKLPDQLKTCFKFSPIEDSLDKNDVGIDLESFKKEYLSEVDREFKCTFKHKHVRKLSPERKFRSPIDFAIEAAVQREIENSSSKRKRKLSEDGIKLVFDKSRVKRRKTSESDLKLVYDYDKKIPESSEDINKMAARNNEGRKKMKKDKRRKKTKERRKARRNKGKSSSDKNIEVTIDSSEKRRAKNKEIKKKIKTKFAIDNDNIQVKIKWKKKQFSLNIESKKQDRKEKKIKGDRSKFKQYVLQFPEGSSKEVLVKPEKEVGPLKRKYFRNEKSPDKLKQMSIQSFFKVKSEN